MAKTGIERANRLHSLVLQAMKLAHEGAAPKIFGPPVVVAPDQEIATPASTFTLNVSAIEADEPHLSIAMSMERDELRRRIEALRKRTSNPL